MLDLFHLSRRHTSKREGNYRRTENKQEMSHLKGSFIRFTANAAKSTCIIHD